MNIPSVFSVFLVSILFAFLAVFLKLWIDLDFNRTVFNHSPGKCQYVEGIEQGSHGIFVLSNGTALITSGIELRAPGFPHVPESGRVYLYDLNSPAKKAILLRFVLRDKSSNYATFNTDKFRPGDITCWEEAGRTVVFIVNTSKREICVFELDIQEKTLAYMKSIADPELTNPNDLVALSEDELYVSNFAHFSNPILINLELAFQMSLGSIFHFNGSHFVKVLDNLNLPDGLALSVNRNYLYVSLFNGRKILFNKINYDKSLEEISQIDINSRLDNIYVDQMDRLWVAAQPVLYEGLMHVQNPKKFKSPSQVFRVSFHRKGGHVVEEVFADDGDKLRFASSAAFYKDVLLIGTLYDRALWCRVKK